MTNAQDKAKIIKLIYGLVFGIISVTLAVLLILQVSDIYFNGGESPYTVDTVKSHFWDISPALFIWLAVAIGGFVIYGIYPDAVKVSKTNAFYTYAVLRERLSERVTCRNDGYKDYEKCNALIIGVRLAVAVCVAVLIAFSIAYLANDKNFVNQNQNKEVAKASLYLLPFVLSSFALIIGVAVFEGFIVKKQIVKAKELIKNPPTDGEEIKNKLGQFIGKIKAFFENKNTVLAMRIALLAVGVALLIYGLATGGNAGVLAKAVTICRQCIGLG